MRGDVEGGPAGQPGQVGDGAEQGAADLFAVAAAEHRLGLALQVADQRLPGVAAAVGVVEGAEQVADGADRGDVAAADPDRGPALPGVRGGGFGGAAGRAARGLLGDPGGAALRGCAQLLGGEGGAVAGDPLVGAADQPVAAGDDESGGREGDLAEFGVGAVVLAPHGGDDVDGLLRGLGELQSGVDRGAGVQADVLGGEPAAEPAGEDLGDEGRGGAARLLAAQPAGHRGLVVAQVEAVFQAELVDPPGEAGVREAGLFDERGELRVLGAPGGRGVGRLGGARRGLGRSGRARVERVERSVRRAVDYGPLGHSSPHLSGAVPAPPARDSAP